MIIGRDKEMVRQLQNDVFLADELIKSIRDDMELIAEQLKKDSIDITSIPYYLISHDIGRCNGYLQIIQEKR